MTIQDEAKANERCLKTLRGLRDTMAKHEIRELYEDLSRAILIVEGEIEKSNELREQEPEVSRSWEREKFSR